MGFLAVTGGLREYGGTARGTGCYGKALIRTRNEGNDIKVGENDR